MTLDDIPFDQWDDYVGCWCETPEGKGIIDRYVDFMNGKNAIVFVVGHGASSVGSSRVTPLMDLPRVYDSSGEPIY